MPDYLLFYQNLKDGQTAIFHVAVKGQGCVDLIEKMVQQGANPNIQDAVSILPKIIDSEMYCHTVGNFGKH